MSVKTPANESFSPAAAATLPADFFDLLEQALPLGRDNAELVRDPDVLIRVIQASAATGTADLTAHISAQLKAQRVSLAPALRVRLLFWQTLFTQLKAVCPLDGPVASELERMRPLFLITGLRDEHLVTAPYHPLRQLVEKILQQGVLWYADGGKENEQFLTALSRAVDSLTATAKLPETLVSDPAISAFIALAERQQHRAKIMEQRYSDSELGMAKIHRAHAQVMALLSVLVGCLLPERVSVFLQTTLRSELQYILINESDTPLVWKSWSEIIKRLPDVFPKQKPEAEQISEPDVSTRQVLFSHVQVILEWLNKVTITSAVNQVAYEEGVEELREQLFGRLRDESPVMIEFEPIAVPDELRAMGTTISPAILKKVAHLRAGDWFFFSLDNQQRLRCKLLLRPPQVEQLLFVNRHGHRVLQKSPHDFSACLATHIAKPLLIEDFFVAALTVTRKKLLVWQQQTLARAQQESSISIAPSKVPPAHPEDNLTADSGAPMLSAGTAAVTSSDDGAVSISTPATDRKSAAAKALQEARVLERLAIRRERQAVASQAIASDGQDSRQEAEQLLQCVNIGAWFDLTLADHTGLQRCKLVAIMRSSNRFIFTNRLGVKVAEHSQAELVELAASGRARVVSNGDDFEGQLTKVVKTLRRDV